MIVEPPPLEIEIGEGSDGSVVVRECISCDVKSIHARMENRCDKSLVKFRKIETGKGAHRHGLGRIQSR